MTGLAGRRVLRLVAAAISGEEIMNSAVARLQATGILLDNRDPEQGLDVRVMRMWLQRIPEEHEQIDPALGDAAPTCWSRRKGRSGSR